MFWRFECLQHLPYIPDLIPMDFAAFPEIKAMLESRFDHLDEHWVCSKRGREVNGTGNVTATVW